MKELNTKTYLGPYQTSVMELFCKNREQLIIFAKLFFRNSWKKKVLPDKKVPDKKVLRKQAERRLRYTPVLLILHVLFANVIELFLTITVAHCRDS